jgi:hypothetical protein
MILQTLIIGIVVQGNRRQRQLRCSARPQHCLSRHEGGYHHEDRGQWVKLRIPVTLSSMVREGNGCYKAPLQGLNTPNIRKKGCSQYCGSLSLLRRITLI